MKPFWDYVRWPVSFVLRCFDMNYWFIQLTPRGATSFTGAQMNKWFTGIKRLGGRDGRPNQAPSLISHISHVQGGNTRVRDVQVTRVHWKCCVLFFSLLLNLNRWTKECLFASKQASSKDPPSSLQSPLSKIQTKPLYISTEGPATHFWDWAKPNIYTILYSTQMNYWWTYGENLGGPCSYGRVVKGS